MLSCFSRVQLFATLRTEARQAPLSMGFSRHEYWSGLLLCSPGNLPNPGIEPVSPALSGRVFTIKPPGKLLQGMYVLPMNQFNLVTQSCPTPCNSMNRSMPGLPVHHQLLQCAQTHVHWVGDAIQPPHPLSSLSPPALNLSQYQGLFQWVSSLHQVAKGLEFQLQHQSFQLFRVDFL